MLDKEYRKVFKTIKSCETMEQLKNAVNMANLYFKSKGIKDGDPEHVSIKTAFDIAKAKCSRMTEEYFASTRDFETASREAGLNISGFVSEEEIAGGLADDKSVKDIADKHSVNIKDIVAQIKKGKKVEMEHTDDPNVAIEIAKDHEMEHPYYYSALEDMEKELEEGSLLLNSILGEEELGEATSAASSGAFVGALGGKHNKRKLHKTNVPVSGAGGMTKPIGKIRSFKKKQLKGSNVITKQEIIDESLGMSAIPIYDSPAGWGDNEFMGTKGKKGNAVQRKGKNYKNTYKFGNNEGSTFVKIKDKCKKFPYCSQGPDAIELSETIPEGENKMKLPSRNDIKEGWKKFVEVAKREGKETTMAAKIIKKILVNEDVSENELKFVKEQSGDILKIFGVVTMGAISTALPILVEKMLNKKGLSILPKERSSILDDKEELIETISEKTGKSKKYVDSLIKRYL